jgi:hypothetical protein
MAEIVGADVKTNYVEWGPVLAGAVAASAISFVLFTAGSAIGLSLLSPFPNQSYGKSAASLAAFWTIVVPIFSLLIGGYLAGRMRAAWSANPDEREFRDGVHGLLVWSTAVVIGGLLAYLAVGTAAHVGGELGKAAIADRGALVATSVDTLLRPTPGPTAPATAQTTAADRDELSRIFVASTADGTLSTADKDYLAQVVSTRTGLPPDAAQKRVDEAYASALEAVDNARQAAVAAGLATATALLVSLAAAWYAAQRGGHHRDQNIPARLTGLPSRARP